MEYLRKEPEIIEAFKWTGTPDQLDDPEWIIKAIKKRNVIISEMKMIIANPGMPIVFANMGDYIVLNKHNGFIEPYNSTQFDDEYKLKD